MASLKGVEVRDHGIRNSCVTSIDLGTLFREWSVRQLPGLAVVDAEPHFV